MKVKISDSVLVTTGKYKGKTGKVLKVYQKSDRLTVEKINFRTRHIKKTAGKAGERIKYEAPLSISNVMVICPHCHKATRVSYLKSDGQKNQRVCKKCGKSLDMAKTIKKKSTK